jgi:PKD repeat protein
VRRALCMVGVLVGLTLAVAVWADSFDSFRMGDHFVCKFTNRTGMTVDALVLVFAEPVDVPEWMAMGGDMVLTSNVDGRIRLDGWLIPNGEISVTWPLDGPGLREASWLVDGEVVETICVSCPTVQLHIVPRNPVATETVLFKSTGSLDPDGAPLVQYLWEWDDGATASGEVAERTYVSPGKHEVTLTVWDEDLQTGSKARSFSVLGAPPAYFTLTAAYLINSLEPMPVLPNELRVYGPGIDFGVAIDWSEEPPKYTLLGADNSETYLAGASVTLKAETAGPYIRFDSWSGCSSTSGNECTVNMSKNTAVQAIFEVKGCFTADTLVLMADGLRKRIADVLAGDVVMAYDFAAGLRVFRMVTQVFQFQTEGFLRINDLEVTPAHRFAVGPDQWVEAGQLAIGDQVLNGDGFTPVTRLEWVDEPASVYTLTIDQAHNFFVSDGLELYLVHNVK